MKYQIVDNSASLRMSCSDGELLLFKRSILRITVVYDDIIGIHNGHPLQSIFFNYRDVEVPRMDSAILLRDFIADLIWS